MDAEDAQDTLTLSLAYPTPEKYFAQVQWGMSLLSGNRRLTSPMRTHCLVWHDASANGRRVQIPRAPSLQIPRAPPHDVGTAVIAHTVHVPIGPVVEGDDVRRRQCAHSFVQTEAHGAFQHFTVPFCGRYHRRMVAIVDAYWHGIVLPALLDVATGAQSASKVADNATVAVGAAGADAAGAVGAPCKKRKRTINDVNGPAPYAFF